MTKTHKKRKFKKYKKRKSKKIHFGGSHRLLPRIIHQIWFGSQVPSWRKYIFDSVQQAALRNGYQYKLWLESDRTRANFPITLPYQNDCLIHGKNAGQNRFAQVADLARLEIVYHYGGVYLDSIFLINDAFFVEIERLNVCENKSFICCNEDPCDLDCENGRGQQYLSNSFFAGTVGNAVLKRLLDTDRLDEIDLASTAINHTTGPYYFRTGITEKNLATVGIIPMSRIYPFPMSGSVMRPPAPNICLTAEQESPEDIPVAKNRYLKHDCLNRLPPDTLAAYMVGLGGSWSL